MSTGLHRMKRRAEVGRERDRILAAAREQNPFTTGFGFGDETCQAVDAQSRLSMVKDFDLHQCRQALKAPGLQLAVQHALERRIRKLRAEVEKGGTG